MCSSDLRMMKYAGGWTDPRGVFQVSNNISTDAKLVTLEAPLVVKTRNGDNVDVVKEILRMRYILQRTVPDYDEIAKQFDALEDIKGAEQWDR